MKRHYMRAAGYEYVRYDRATHYHILKEVKTNRLEKWICCGRHDDIGITYKNTHLRFIDTID